MRKRLGGGEKMSHHTSRLSRDQYGELVPDAKKKQHNIALSFGAEEAGKK